MKYDELSIPQGDLLLAMQRGQGLSQLGKEYFLGNVNNVFSSKVNAHTVRSLLRRGALTRDLKLRESLQVK